jgi:hypothetical protein
MSGKAIRETVGFLGVVASLVFVGLEIRQNTATARGQTRQELASLNQEWLILQSTDSAFADLFRRAWVLNDSLSVDEAWRAAWGMRLNLRRLENVYFQFVEGLVDESALNSYGFQATPMFRSEAFNRFWVAANERGAYDPGFVRFFEAHFSLPTG